MERSMVLLVALLLVSVYGRGDVCKKKTCPHFEVVNTSKDYEERFYNVTEWITTKIENDGVILANLRLMKYCERQKKAGFEFPEDAWPVLITEQPNGYNLSWFVPPGTVKSEISFPSVTVISRPAGTYYVRSFDGSPSLERGEKEKKLLREALEEDSKPYDQHTFTGAAYQPYFHPVQHNEIWVQAA